MIDMAKSLYRVGDFESENFKRFLHTNKEETKVLRVTPIFNNENGNFPHTQASRSSRDKEDCLEVGDRVGENLGPNNAVNFRNEFQIKCGHPGKSRGGFLDVSRLFREKAIESRKEETSMSKGLHRTSNFTGIHQEESYTSNTVPELQQKRHGKLSWLVSENFQPALDHKNTGISNFGHTNEDTYLHSHPVDTDSSVPKTITNSGRETDASNARNSVPVVPQVADIIVRKRWQKSKPVYSKKTDKNKNCNRSASELDPTPSIHNFESLTTGNPSDFRNEYFLNYVNQPENCMLPTNDVHVSCCYGKPQPNFPGCGWGNERPNQYGKSSYAYQGNGFIPYIAGGINISILMPYPTMPPTTNTAHGSSTTPCKKRKDRKKKLRRKIRSQVCSKAQMDDTNVDDPNQHPISRVRFKLPFFKKKRKKPKLQNGNFPVDDEKSENRVTTILPPCSAKKVPIMEEENGTSKFDHVLPEIGYRGNEHLRNFGSWNTLEKFKNHATVPQCFYDEAQSLNNPNDDNHNNHDNNDKRAGRDRKSFQNFMPENEQSVVAAINKPVFLPGDGTYETMKSLGVQRNIQDKDMKIDAPGQNGKITKVRLGNRKREALNDDGNYDSSDYQGYFRLSSGKSPTSFIMFAFRRGRTNHADDNGDKDFEDAGGVWKFRQQLSK